MIELNATINSIYTEFRDVTVFYATTENGKRVRMVGQRDSVFSAGEYRTFFGKWETYEDAGKQFQVQKSALTSVTNTMVKSFLMNQTGIGDKTAQKLIQYFGPELPKLLDDANETPLTEVDGIGNVVALQAIQAWHEQGAKSQLIDYISKPLENDTTLIGTLTKAVLKAHEFYQHKTLDTLKKNPYLLWAFCTWNEVDKLAQALGVKKDDERRLTCAFEEALYRLYGEGHTAPIPKLVNNELKIILRGKHHCLATFESAREDGLNTKRFFVHDNGCWSLPSSVIMESFVHDELLRRAKTDNIKQDSLLGDVSGQEYLLPGDYALDTMQELSVNHILKYGVVLIIGAAGTGKTSVLYAANDLLHQTGRHVLQVALSGKAAQRLMQQTDQEAFTIESLLSKIKASPRFLDKYDLPVLFIDEASMVDLPLMYRILQAFKDREVKIVAIGDRGQLPPIGAGLVFHKMIECNIFPIVELKTNYRTLAGSTIPEISEIIRNGGTFKTTKDVTLIESTAYKMVEDVVEQYLKNQSYKSVQIISATKRVMAKANRRLQSSLLETATVVPNTPEFRIGDKIIYKKNRPNIGLVNGSMGVIVEPQGDLVLVDQESNETVKPDMVVEFESEGRIPLLLSQIKSQHNGEWFMQHAYALTGHQAQGSEFDCVIIALEKSKILDRSWLYTAITRAKQKIIFIGNASLIQDAINIGNIADNRHVGLRFTNEN